MCASVLKYGRGSLMNLRRGSGYPPSDIIQRLKNLDLFRNRGTRAGKDIRRPIKVITTSVRKERPQPKLKEYQQIPAPKPLCHLEVPTLRYSFPTVLLSNVTSLSNKIDEVHTAITTHRPGLVAITEAWQIDPDTISISDYHMFHNLRTNRRGGGVVMFAHQSLQPASVQVDVPEELEVLWVRVTPPRHPRHSASLLCCVVYHPPRAATKSVLLHHITHTSDLLKVRYPSSKLIICGDFNEIDTTDVQDELNIRQIVNFPTHGNNILDIILTDLEEYYNSPQPLAPFGRSNHLSILWTPKPSVSHKIEVATKIYRPLKQSSILAFGNWLVHYPWAEVLTVEDVEEKWENYITTITASYHHFFPEKSLRQHPADLPWITDKIKRLINQRNHAHRTGNTDLYRPLRNKVIREIKFAKSNFYPNKLQELKTTDQSKWYGKIKELCGLNKPSRTPPCLNHLSSQSAAEEVNRHFANICQRLPRLDATLLPAYLPMHTTAPAVLEYQVSEKIKKMKTKRSVTPIDIPMTLLKEFAPELSTPLTSIINASLQQGKSPSAWKTSYVTAVPKTPSPATLDETRPVSITPVPSLLCESFVADWAYTDLSPFFDRQQYGNIRSTSTSHYLVSLLDYIYTNLEKRKTSVAATFIDFSKAFDLVDHTTVIKKAAALGLRECLVAWLADFLTDRHQAVRMQGATSTSLPLTCGVPQGTKIGPLCFLVLINDALSDTTPRWKYVDDSTVATDINNSSPNYQTLQDSLSNLLTWTNTNHVTLNSRKTVVMHFDLATTPTQPPALTIGDHILEVVKSAKILGVIIDDKLNWDLHVSTIVSSTSFRLYMLRRLKSLGVPTPELSNIFKTFILPKLTYASPAWSSSLNNTQLHRLERVQKRAAKIILGPSYVGYEAALATLGLTTLSALYQRTLLQFGRQLLKSNRHRELLPPSAPPPRRAVRTHNKLLPTRSRTDRHRNSPVPTIVRLINGNQ